MQSFAHPLAAEASGEPVTVPEGHVTAHRIKPMKVITAGFGDGQPPVTITLWRVAGTFGVGVYPSSSRGVGLRWHEGPDSDPRVIYWHAPQCPEDVCR